MFIMARNEVKQYLVLTCAVNTCQVFARRLEKYWGYIERYTQVIALVNVIKTPWVVKGVFIVIAI